jgi:uncharacterized protein
MRTCVGCRGVAARGELLRLVVGADGEVRVDPRAISPGRGAYVHRERSCVDRALERGGATLYRALRHRADPDAAVRLRREIEGEIA